MNKEIKLAIASALTMSVIAACGGKEKTPLVVAPATPTPSGNVGKVTVDNVEFGPTAQAYINGVIATAVAKSTEKVPTLVPTKVAEATVKPTPAERPVYPAPGYDVYTPRPESSIYGDFYSVRFNQNTGRYDLIDTRVNQRVNTAEHMVQPIENILTGVGNTRQITYSLRPGEAAVEQGNNIDGEQNGVFQIRVNRTDHAILFGPTIGDGAVTRVPIANVAAHAVDALNRAVDNHWAHNNVRGER